MPVKSQKDKFTGDVFVYKFEPEPSNKRSYIINTPRFKMFSEFGKSYILDSGEITQIDTGAYNSAIQSISGLSDEAAADKIKTQFRSGSIKIVKTHGTSNRNKMYQHI
jgi:hypothetical protein